MVGVGVMDFMTRLFLGTPRQTAPALIPRLLLLGSAGAPGNSVVIRYTAPSEGP